MPSEKGPSGEASRVAFKIGMDLMGEPPLIHQQDKTARTLDAFALDAIERFVWEWPERPATPHSNNWYGWNQLRSDMLAKIAAMREGRGSSGCQNNQT